VFLDFLLLCFCSFFSCSGVSVRSYELSSEAAVGRVVYEQYTKLECEKHLNGPASLWFNHYEAVYVHDAYPAQSSMNDQSVQIKLVSGDEEGLPVYMNLKTKVLIFKDYFGFSPLASIIQDSLPEISWHILDEHRQIGGHPCQKAEGEFAGRLYEAWFATDIPVPFGPYKLWGLPGLILEAKTDDESVQFLFKGLELSDALADRVFVPSKGRDRFNSYEEFHRAEEAMYECEMREARAEGRMVRIIPAPWDCKIEIRE